MVRVLRPFGIFENPVSTVCIWLNGEPEAIGRRGELIWNGAGRRVATDGAFNEIQKRREKNGDVEWPHAVCGDLDSLTRTRELANCSLIHLPDQDKTDLTKTIEWCLEEPTGRSFERFAVLGGLNGRFDHTMSTLSTLATFVNNPKTVVVLDSRNLVIAVPEAEEVRIELNLEMCSRMCGVIPLAQKETRVTSNGLKYEMNDLSLAFGQMISSCNTMTSDRITLKSTAPVLFTIELSC